MSRSVPVVSFLSLVALVLVSAACRRDDAHDHAAAPSAHGHEHAPTERTLARLGERYLVHLIHPGFVRGQRTAVLVHGTRVDAGTPIDGGKLAVVARADGSAPLRFDAMQRSPGAWPVDVELPAAGAWTLAIEVDSGNGVEAVE